MGLTFCPTVKNVDELILFFNQGRWDKSIFDYLIEIMIDKENHVLPYSPLELFDMQAELKQNNQILCLQFWDINNSGTYENNRYILSNKDRELFNLFVSRINEIYDNLKNLVSQN